MKVVRKNVSIEIVSKIYPKKGVTLSVKKIKIIRTNFKK